MSARHLRTCTLCEAMCGVVIETSGGAITSIRGDKEDPFSRGHICPKAMGLKDVHEDPDRLRTPLRREGKTWKSIGWDEAFDEVARGLTAVQRAHGKSAVGVYQGNPTVHNYGSMLFGPMFVRSLRTRSRFSATSVDQLPHMLSALLMFGHQLLVPVPDIDRTDFFLVLGANPVVSNGSLMTAPGAASRIEAIRARGGRVVVVDPRRSETAALADAHHFIRPGTDALLLAALVQTVLAEGRERLGVIADFTHGLDVVRERVAPFTPERVAATVGIDAETIRSLARAFAAAKSAVCYGRVGVCTQDFGGLACWLVNVLNIVTGNLDRPGGAMFTTPAVDVVGLTGKTGQAGHFARYRSRVRALPEFGGELPVAVLAEEIETPGKGQIRAMVTSCGNPVLSTPNGGRLDRALASLDFMVSIDFYLNETTRHAHVILPPTFALEHDHYDLAFHVLAVRNTAKYSLPMVERPASARHDWEIFNELTARMAGGGRLSKLKASARALAMRRLKPAGLLDGMLRIGPHGDRFLPFHGGLNLQKLKDAPHGVDLGPLQPTLPGKLQTRDGAIALAPPELLSDLARLEASLGERASTSLQLIGRRELRTNNSWMHNSLRLVKGPRRCTLRMHPRDATARGLTDGADVRITSRVGAVTAPLEVTDEVMPGVVSLPHGWGHDRAGVRLAVAEAHAGVSINDLTDELRVDALSGNASFSGVAVEVTAAARARDHAPPASPRADAAGE
jgi:anaerobic selenocysteine-containing dehydrogenase